MVETRAREAGAARVLRVVIRVGEGAGVEVDLLRTAWEGVRRGTLCDLAGLVVERVPVAWICALCRKPVEGDSPLRCPDCGYAAVLDGGDELTLERFEIERA